MPRRRPDPRRKKFFYIGALVLGVGLLGLLATVLPLLSDRDYLLIVQSLLGRIWLVLGAFLCMAVGMFMMALGIRSLGVPDLYHPEPPPKREDDLEGWLEDQGVDTSGRFHEEADLVVRLRSKHRAGRPRYQVCPHCRAALSLDVSCCDSCGHQIT